MLFNKLLSHYSNSSKLFTFVVGYLYIIFVLIPIHIWQNLFNIRVLVDKVSFLLRLLYQRSYFFTFNYLNGGLNGYLTYYMVYKNKIFKNRYEYLWFNNYLISSFRECVNHTQKFISNLKGDNLRAVDLACGVMYLWWKLPKNVLSNFSQIDGYDLDANSIHLAKKYINKKKLTNFNPRVDSVDNLGGKYDVITIYGFSFYLPNKFALKELLLKCKLCLKPGGYVIVNFIGPQNEWRLEYDTVKHQNFLHQYMQTVRAEWRSLFISDDDLTNLAKEIGLTVNTIYHGIGDIHRVIYLTRS
jgi:2-polyprenyl-3-methyl-5-hydroxy-6-metoxy-1,4-benzoquinol methylase